MLTHGEANCCILTLVILDPLDLNQVKECQTNLKWVVLPYQTELMSTQAGLAMQVGLGYKRCLISHRRFLSPTIFTSKGHGKTSLPLLPLFQFPSSALVSHLSSYHHWDPDSLVRHCHSIAALFTQQSNFAGLPVAKPMLKLVQVIVSHPTLGSWTPSSVSSLQPSPSPATTLPNLAPSMTKPLSPLPPLLPLSLPSPSLSPSTKPQAQRLGPDPSHYLSSFLSVSLPFSHRTTSTRGGCAMMTSPPPLSPPSSFPFSSSSPTPYPSIPVSSSLSFSLSLFQYILAQHTMDIGHVPYWEPTNIYYGTSSANFDPGYFKQRGWV